MGGIIGIIACVIAAIKGRTTFAWVVGIWTAIAVVIALAGAPQFAIAPGGLFLIIAIAMKKAASDAESSPDQERNTTEESSSDSSNVYKFACKNCKTQLTGWYKECPNCHAIDTIVKKELVPDSIEVHPLTLIEEERNRHFNIISFP